MPLPVYKAQLTDAEYTVKFHGWTGWFPGLQDQGEDYQRLGGVASGAQITGTRADKKECTAWTAFASKNEMLAFIVYVEALQWRTMAWTGPWGVTKTVRITKATADPVYGRGVVNFRVDCTFEGERLS